MKRLSRYLVICCLTLLFDQLIFTKSNDSQIFLNITSDKIKSSNDSRLNNKLEYNLTDIDMNFEDVEFEWKGRVLVIGDIHGDLKSLITSLYLSGVINNNLDWIARNTLLVQLGDIVDRGHYALQIYKLFNKLRIQASSMNSKFVGLLGNHEIMNICGQFHYVTEEDFKTYGGRDNRIYEWSKEGFIGNYLKTLKLAVRINDSLYIHAGLLPKYAKMGLKALGRLTHNLLEGNFCDSYSSIFFAEDGPLWTRDISLTEETIACKLVNETLDLLKLERMVIGHTIQIDNRINVKCNNKLYLVDTGFSEAIYGKPCLLELMYYKNETQLLNSKSKYSFYTPYSINELVIKSDEFKKSIKYIEINNFFYKNETFVNEQINKDEL